MKMKQKQMHKKYQTVIVLAVLCSMLAMPIVAVADAAAVAVLNVVPTSDSKVVTVMGNGFNPDESVYLALTNATTGIVVYNFTESPATSNIGAFTTDLTLPPGIYGAYSIYAETSTVSANKDYTIVFVTNPKIAVTPPNSNIFKVSGSGFTPFDVAAFTLMDNRYASAYNFTDVGVADNQGNFTATLIVPTSLNGNYTLFAATRTGLTANASITVPDLTGPKGDTGDDGDRGPKGVAGESDGASDGTLVYVAIVVSVIAVVLSAASLLRGREPDDEDD